uniref:ATP synthase complex subunit 8 n=1 Tax=Takydromus wolteri TaxID=235402 RepID=J9QDM2_9SAUR|nr:ATP synthase F0 subunit 8 [Takydromus wolteri]AFN87681.1 ATPase 8 [Takydromus wolteri]
MPQLNPAPWFLVLLLVWFSLFILSTKIMQNQSKLSTPQHSKQLYYLHWTWPWS